LLHFERYEDINRIITRTFFLKNDPTSEIETASKFTAFFRFFDILERTCKLNSENLRLFTLAGDIVVKREKKPIITKKSLVEADLVLYQVSYAIFEPETWKWFPSLYVYRSSFQSQKIWTRLLSRRYCEKLFPLFGVASLGKLKEKVGKCVYDNIYKHGNVNYGHYISGNAHYAAPNILTSIKLEEVGSLD